MKKIKELKYLLNSNSIIISIQLIGYFFRLIINYYFVHAMTKAYYGDFVLAKYVLYECVGLVSCTSSTVYKYFQTQNRKELPSFIKWNIYLVYKIIIFIFIFIIPIYFFVFFFHWFDIKDFQSYHLTLIFFLLLPFSCAISILISWIRASNFNVLAQFVPLIILPLSIGVLMFFFLYSGQKIDNISLFSIYLVSYLFIITCSSYAYNKINPQFQIFRKILKSSETNDKKSEWNKQTKKFFTLKLLALTYSLLPFLILELGVKNESLLGYYGVCYLIFEIIVKLIPSVFYKITPKIYRLCHQKRTQQVFQKSYNKQFYFSISILIPIIILIFTFAKFILGLFGKDFENYAIVLRVLCLDGFVYFLSFPLILFLKYLGNEKFLKKIRFIGLILAIIIWPVMTFYYSVIGLVLGQLAVGLILFVLMFKKHKKYFKNNVFVII